MRLREVIYCVFSFDSLADALDLFEVRSGIFGRVELAEGHIEDIGGLILVEYANGFAVYHVAGRLDAVKARKVSAPLRVSVDFSRQAV